MKVYLAGPIASRDLEGATIWRAQAKNLLRNFGIQGYSPLRGKEHLVPQTGPIGSNTDNYIPNPLTSAKGITARDRYDVQSSNLMIANLLGMTDKPTGTAIEFGWADAFSVPVIMIIEASGSLAEHPMLVEIAGFRVESVEAACTLAAQILLP